MDTSDRELAQLAHLTGAAERVHFLGPQFKLEDLVPAFDVAVSSSRMSEGFQNVLAEAMACGVPAVSTDIGEAATIIADPARLVPRSNPDALAAAVSMPRTRASPCRPTTCFADDSGVTLRGASSEGFSASRMKSGISANPPACTTCKPVAGHQMM